MTEAEAVTIQRIVNYADGGCPSCARALTQELIAAFPEHRDTFVLTFAEVHSDEVSELELP